MTQKSLIKPMPSLPTGVDRRAYESDTARPLKPELLSIALALLFIDILAVVLLQTGGAIFGRRLGRAGAAAIAVLALGAAAYVTAWPASAQTAPARPSAADTRAIQATGKVTFGYVVSGDPSTDQTSRQGLIGLGKFLTTRTAVEPGEPYAVNILTDEIAFYPMLYWPVLASAKPLPDATLAKIDAYMKQGGMIIFDTKDYGQGIPTGFTMRGEGTPLQRLLGNLDIPRLEPVPEQPRAHQVILLAAQLPRPLGRRTALGAGRGARRQRAGPAGPPRRRRQLDPDHLQRLRGGLGAG